MGARARKGSTERSGVVEMVVCAQRVLIRRSNRWYDVVPPKEYAPFKYMQHLIVLLVLDKGGNEIAFARGCRAAV